MTVPVIDIQKQSESIKMTLPVIDISNQEGTHTVQFTMPSKYTLENLPKPNNPRVVFREIPPTVRAVLRYTGFANERKVVDKKQVLKTLLQRDKFQIT
jgi:SOUL heme-binding protein